MYIRLLQFGLQLNRFGEHVQYIRNSIAKSVYIIITVPAEWYIEIIHPRLPVSLVQQNHLPMAFILQRSLLSM